MSLVGCFSPGLADGVHVPPGEGTLSAAVAAAADGDTLLLQGDYYEASNVQLDKSLTLAALEEGVPASVTALFYVNGGGEKKVRILGLDLFRNVYVYGDENHSAEIVGNRFHVDAGVGARCSGCSMMVVDNQFDLGSINSDTYSPYDWNSRAGHILIVGNRLESGSLRYLYADVVHIAANYLDDGTVTLRANDAWIIGNRFDAVTDEEFIAIQGSARMIGNRFHLQTSRSNLSAVSSINGSAVFVAGNVLRVDYEGSGGSYCQAVYCHGVNWCQALNNLILLQGPDGSPISADCDGISGAQSMVGNIMLGVSGQPFTSTDGIPMHNLCFGGAEDCGDEHGNLNLDPQLANATDYRPTPGSPVIDAGPTNLYYADLDLSRNDIGPYGGPWSIAQYDAQRESTTSGPYAFPLFDARQGVNAAPIHVKALGVARFR